MTFKMRIAHSKFAVALLATAAVGVRLSSHGKSLIPELIGALIAIVEFLAFD
jgi:hypothetical protein